jgi:hypothetical protein
MILRPYHYEPDPENSEEHPRLAIDDVHSLEVQADHKEALTVIQDLMHVHDLTMDSLRDELLVGGVDWAKAGDATIDLSALAT